jgi:hypothetical protein
MANKFEGRMLNLAMKTSTIPTTNPWLPSPPVCGKLFVTGATLGPVLDGLHNQCLLQYKVAPIVLDLPGSILSTDASAANHLFATSGVVPPLLGIAFIVLGGILPRVTKRILLRTLPAKPEGIGIITAPKRSTTDLAIRSILTILSTAAILKGSEYFALSSTSNPIMMNTAVFESSTATEQELLILITAAIVQWAYLDGTLVSLLVASLASILGPISEIPFLAGGFWEYLEPDYFPLASFDSVHSSVGINSITGPCYFSVTSTAIALGRWLDATTVKTTTIKKETLNSSDPLSEAETPQQVDKAALLVKDESVASKVIEEIVVELEDSIHLLPDPIDDKKEESDGTWNPTTKVSIDIDTANSSSSAESSSSSSTSSSTPKQS